MSAIRLLRWRMPDGRIRLGIDAGAGRAVPVDEELAGVDSVDTLQRSCRAMGMSVAEWAAVALDEHRGTEEVPAASCVAPVNLSELWASGVTYEMSRDAREAETSSALNLYAKVYGAERPELFFKAPGNRVVGPNDFVGLRRDAVWHVPEPELTAVLDDRGHVFGYTLGNDMTARDLEAENPLYLPQTKMFHHGASIGPAIVLAGTINPYDLTITLEIQRRGKRILSQSTSTRRITRHVEELVDYLARAWPLAPWTGLMTGTGIVPPDEFALEDGDEILITVPEIGTLRNVARPIEPSWADVPPGRPRVLRIDSRDNVAIALGALHRGERITVDGRAIVVRDDIPFGHKVALEEMPQGHWVIKYGERIGIASQSIHQGQHVHTQNLESQRGRGDLLRQDGGQRE